MMGHTCTSWAGAAPCSFDKKCILLEEFGLQSLFFVYSEKKKKTMVSFSI